MHGSSNHRTESRFLKLSALASNTVVATDQSLRGAGAQTNNNRRTNYRDFSVQPWAAGSDFLRIGLFVNSPLTALNRIEMFDHIGDIHLVARDSRGEQSLVEQFSGRPD